VTRVESANVALIKGQIDAYNRGDWEAAFAGMTADVEWVIAREHPAARTVRGLDELGEYHRDWQETLPGLTIEVLETDERGDAVLSVCRLRGAGAGSGAEVGVEIAFISRRRDGRVVRVEEYLDADEARAAI